MKNALKFTGGRDTGEHITVWIDETPHLVFPADKLGFMSYIGKDDGRCYIEWSWNGGGFTSDYDDRELWETILYEVWKLV